MSRKDQEYRKRRERKKKEQRRREEEQRRSRAAPKVLDVLKSLREIFHQDTSRAIALALSGGLSDEQIAQQLNVPVSRVQRLLDLVADLPPAVSTVLQAHPEVLSNPDALAAIISVVRHQDS